jgi:hypothetical protein
MITLRHFIRSPIPSSGVNLSCRTEAHRGLLDRYSMLNRADENHSQTRIIPNRDGALYTVGIFPQSAKTIGKIGRP